MAWKSGNYIGTGIGKHAYKYRKYKADFKAKATPHLLNVDKASGKRRLEMTRLKGYQANPMDPDNLRAGAKPLIDILVAMDLLIDDSPQHLELALPKQIKSHNKTNYIQLRFIDYEEKE